MQHPFRAEPPTCHNLKLRLTRFARQEDGVVTALACFIIIMMVLIGGIGVDLMRNEMERVRVQNTSDRAVLAAADLDQDLDPSAVVQDYFNKSGLSQYTPTVTVDQGLTHRNVIVRTNETTPTRFMRFMGVDALPMPSTSAAEEKVNKVEISLVLDISGSMNDNNKIGILKTAAKDFVDTVITTETRDRVSLTLVPYSEHVNPGRDIASRMNINYVHEYGAWPNNGDINCIEFPDIAFADIEIDLAYVYDQTQHFQWNWTSVGNPGDTNSRDDTVCPRNQYETITPFSQDTHELNQQISRLAPRAGTAIYLGMKWAAGMLDPAFQPMTAQLASAGVVENVFANRPAPYSDSETIKTVVLMTDGMNSNSNRIAPNYYSNFNHSRHWDRHNFQRFLLNNVAYWQRHLWYSNVMTPDRANQLLYSVCDAAKAREIVIWTIGFEVDDPSAAIMQNCASSPSHFFRVEGADIADAFKAIAKQIQQLRLTQ